MEPGFGEDVRLQPPLSPPSPPRIKHKSHIEPIRITPTKKAPRVRHNSEPFNQKQGEGEKGGLQVKQLSLVTH